MDLNIDTENCLEYHKNLVSVTGFQGVNFPLMWIKNLLACVEDYPVKMSINRKNFFKVYVKVDIILLEKFGEFYYYY